MGQNLMGLRKVNQADKRCEKHLEEWNALCRRQNVLFSGQGHKRAGEGEGEGYGGVQI